MSECSYHGATSRSLQAWLQGNNSMAQLESITLLPFSHSLLAFSLSSYSSSLLFPLLLSSSLLVPLLLLSSSSSSLFLIIITLDIWLQRQVLPSGARAQLMCS